MHWNLECLSLKHRHRHNNPSRSE